MSPAALEAYIKDCGRQMEAEYAAGNREAAEHWQQEMLLAISQRSPEHQALMTAEIDRRISEGPDYFQVIGRQHRQELAA